MILAFTALSWGICALIGLGAGLGRTQIFQAESGMGGSDWDGCICLAAIPYPDTCGEAGYAPAVGLGLHPNLPTGVRAGPEPLEIEAQTSPGWPAFAGHDN